VATDGYHHRRARYRIRDEPAAQTEDFFDERFADHFGRRAVSNNSAGIHRDEVVAVAGCVIQIVEHEHDRALLAQVEIDEQIEHFYLVGEIEERRRFVEQHEVRALCEGHRDPYSLALATGELVNRPGCEIERAGRPHRLGDHCFVGGGPLAKPFLMGIPAARDEIGDGDPLGRDRRLRQDAQSCGNDFGGKSVNALAVEQHRARLRLVQPGECP
jgi:hypothetical protein